MTKEIKRYKVRHTAPDGTQRIIPVYSNASDVALDSVLYSQGEGSVELIHDVAYIVDVLKNGKEKILAWVSIAKPTRAEVEERVHDFVYDVHGGSIYYTHWTDDSTCEFMITTGWGGGFDLTVTIHAVEML